MNDIPRILIIVLEYAPAHQRVMVRGVWPEGAPLPPPLAPENTQNKVKVFEAVDMKAHVGFAGLVPA